VGVAHDAAADGDQPADSVRAVVRSGGDGRAPRHTGRQEKSILDSITAEAGDLRRALGSRDRTRVSEYLDNLRESNGVFSRRKRMARRT